MVIFQYISCIDDRDAQHVRSLPSDGAKKPGNDNLNPPCFTMKNPQVVAAKSAFLSVTICCT